MGDDKRDNKNDEKGGVIRTLATIKRE